MLMRVFLRTLVLLVTVLGTSLAFAWVWDRTEPRPTPSMGATAPATPPAT